MEVKNWGCIIFVRFIKFLFYDYFNKMFVVFDCNLIYLFNVGIVDVDDRFGMVDGGWWGVEVGGWWCIL